MPTIDATTIKPSPALTIMAVEAQSLIVLNGHCMKAPSMAANPTALIASLIVIWDY